MISNITDRIANTTRALVNVDNQTEYSPPNQRFIDRHKNDIIVKMEITRNPVSKFIEGALNVLSNGKLEKSGVGTLYHLSANLFTSNGDKFSVQKNERLAFSDRTEQVMKGGDQITLAVPSLKFEDMLTNTKRKLGEAYMNYSVSNSSRAGNCQQFLWGLVSSNGLGTPSIEQFIMQDVGNTFHDKNRNVKRVSDTLVNIGKVANIVSSGGSIKNFVLKKKDLKITDSDKIRQVCNKMGLSLDQVCFRDDYIDRPGYSIINLQSSKDVGGGTHWTLVKNDGNGRPCIYFDSFGCNGPENIERDLMNYGGSMQYNKDQIQSFDSDACAYFCIAALKYLEAGYTLKEFTDLFSDNVELNNDKLIKVFNRPLIKGKGVTWSRQRQVFPVFEEEEELSPTVDAEEDNVHPDMLMNLNLTPRSLNAARIIRERMRNNNHPHRVGRGLKDASKEMEKKLKEDQNRNIDFSNYAKKWKKDMELRSGESEAQRNVRIGNSVNDFKRGTYGQHHVTGYDPSVYSDFINGMWR